MFGLSYIILLVDNVKALLFSMKRGLVKQDMLYATMCYNIMVYAGTIQCVLEKLTSVI